VANGKILLDIAEVSSRCSEVVDSSLVNFINVFLRNFFAAILAQRKLQSQMFQLCNFWRQNIGGK